MVASTIAATVATAATSARVTAAARAAATALALCPGLLWSPAALAQTVPDAGRLLEETRPPPRPPLPPQTAPKIIDAPVRPTVSMPDGMSVTVTGFRITGARSFSEAELRELVKPWVGRKLDIAGLNEAAGAITRQYQSAGHLLTYAYLPAQRVADGVIEIAVLEGRLEAVQTVTAQDVRLRDEVVQAHTEALATDPAAPRPVLQADIERKLLLLNDIPGVAARGAFTPGGSTGAADMVVSVAEDEPLLLRAEVNNHGSRSTGEYRAGLSLQLRDLSGWGDNVQAQALVSNRGGLVSGTLGASLPVGGDGVRLGGSLSHLTYQLGGAFQNLGATGSANALRLDASYPLLRSIDSNVNLKLGAEAKRLRDDVQLVGSVNPKRSNSVDASASFDLRDSWRGVSAGSVIASVGSLTFLNDERRRLDADGLQTGRRYGKLLAQAVRQQSLTGPFSLYLRAAGQYSGGNLDSSEKFSLAGPGGVRAYAPGEASVDQGGLLSVELRYAQDYMGGGLVWGLFHERGEGGLSRRPLVAAGNDARLSGTGLAVQWNGGDVGLSASVAWRGSHMPLAEGGDPRPRVYFQLVLTP